MRLTSSNFVPRELIVNDLGPDRAKVDEVLAKSAQTTAGFAGLRSHNFDDYPQMD